MKEQKYTRFQINDISCVKHIKDKNFNLVSNPKLVCDIDI